MKSGNNDRSTTSVPTSSLQSTHLALTPNTAVDNDECQRHAEKLISLDLKNGEKTKLPIWRTRTHWHQVWEAITKVGFGVGEELRRIYSLGHRSHHPNGTPQLTNCNLNYWDSNERDPLLSCGWSGKKEEDTNTLAGGDGREMGSRCPSD
jgi:hypothetical protein